MGPCFTLLTPSAMKESQVPLYGNCQKGTSGSSFPRERVTLCHHGKQNLKLKNPREKKSRESERVDPARGQEVLADWGSRLHFIKLPEQEQS